MDESKLRRTKSPINVYNSLSESVKSGDVIYQKKVRKDSYVFRLNVEAGVFTGVYPRVMLSVLSEKGRYRHRAVKVFDRMSVKFSHFAVPDGHTIKLTYLSDDEGFLRDANVRLEIK